ncbi:outer membrane immunogenic protein [Rhizobiales bacterium GAS188]|nr:outer membrane immunogenic protein [Rhizobiales bacterium GAS188]
MRAKPVRSLAVLAVLVLCGLGVAAQADDTPPAKLPTFALNPQAPWTAAGTPSTSPWSGLYVGSEVFAASIKGRKGLVGGSAYAGYNREFDNNLVIGIQGSTGFAASSFKRGPFVGYDYAATNVKLGYDMGRLMPFVTAGFAFAKPTTGSGFTGASDSINDLFGSSSGFRGAGMVGAGFNYAITNNTSVGLAVSAGMGRGGPLLVP